MDADFWLSRWQEGRIGFHQNRPTPLLLKHWPSVHPNKGERVFVPLCGKSLDMPWFASQGFDVLGCELAPLAVAQLFEELSLEPDVASTRYGVHHSVPGIEIILGDAFALDAAVLADCTLVFDRAALIALPPPLRERYVRDVYGALPTGCRGLLITLEYPQHEKDGPPFSVAEAEVRSLFEPAWQVEVLERCDILQTQPAFVDEGVSALHTAVYRITRS